MERDSLVKKEVSALAITSLIFGIASWIVIPILGSIVAIITGHMARGDIRRNPDTKQGDGLAIGGLILGWLNVLIGVIVVLFFGGVILAALGIALTA
jgi:Domain of unknown function (DUF4190)